MSVFRKVCSFVWLIAFMLGVGGIAASWFGVQPIAGIVDSCRSQAWFAGAMAALLAVSAAGVLFESLRVAFARGKGAYQEAKNEFGSVQISRGTIEHAVQSAVGRHAELRFEGVHVRILGGRKPAARIDVRVVPCGLVAVNEVAPALQAEIKRSVEKLTGNPVERIVVDVRDNKEISELLDMGGDEVEATSKASATPAEPTTEDGELALPVAASKDE